MAMQMTSKAFQDGGAIPQKHTGEGEDISPALEWTSVPDDAMTLALIADDPDAPDGTWVHWVFYNLPAHILEIPENLPREGQLENGIMQGQNDFKNIGYGGPCPPSGTHRYVFKLFALDKELELQPGASKRQLLQAMEGHILDRAQFMGTYSKT
jgi:Raf kinase inhibitor-like YbhB/YbcL family protein